MWVTGQFLVGDSLEPIAEDPELTMGQADRDRLEDELVDRLLALLCSSGGQRFRNFVRIHNPEP